MQEVYYFFNELLKVSADVDFGVIDVLSVLLVVVVGLVGDDTVVTGVAGGVPAARNVIRGTNFKLCLVCLLSYVYITLLLTIRLD